MSRTIKRLGGYVKRSKLSKKHKHKVMRRYYKNIDYSTIPSKTMQPSKTTSLSKTKYQPKFCCELCKKYGRAIPRGLEKSVDHYLKMKILDEFIKSDKLFENHDYTNTSSITKKILLKKIKDKIKIRSQRSNKSLIKRAAYIF